MTAELSIATTRAVAWMLAQQASDAPGPSGVEALESMPSFGEAFVRMLFVLGAIIVVLLLVTWLVRRLGGIGPTAKPGRLIEVVDARRLEPRSTLYIVKVAGRYMLLSSSETGLRAVTDRELDADAVEAALREQTERSEASVSTSNSAFARLLRGRRDG